MRERNKKKKSSLTGFIRYTDDRMNGDERNALERELQKDHFADEALEGLSSITSREALEDISSLQNQLKNRVVNRQRYIFYRIAASIAVLIAISSIFIIVEINKPKQAASGISRSEPATIAESGPITSPAGKMERTEQPVSSREKKSESSGDKNNKSKEEQPPVPVENNLIAGYQLKDSISEVEVKLPEADFKQEQIAAVSRAATGAKKSELNAADVTDYEATKAVAEKKDMPDGYMPPQPAGGKSGFDKYIRENLHRPDTLSSEQRVIVVLNFLVLTNGRIDSIRVIRSEGKAFSDEAIRLLRSGPAWMPAEVNGKLVEDKVSVRIVFE
jgi:outer membrane biosynthesis protein TonB